MGRRRFQQPSIFKTTGKRPMWYFRARIDAITTDDGERGIARPEVRRYIGYCDEMTKQDAKKRRDEILSEGINKPQVLITSQVKFSEVLKVYSRDHLAELRDTTRRQQQGAINTHFAKKLGPLRMCDLDALAVQRFLSSLDFAYSTKLHYLRLLKVIWGKAEEWGFTQQRFPRGKFALGVNKAVKGKEMPTIDQLRKLLAALEDPYRAMAEVALYSGLRISEIRGLKWSDVGEQRFTMRRRVSQENGVDAPKNGKERVFDVRPVAAVFARLKRTSEWVFYAEGQGYGNCGKHMRKAREAAGITTARFGWHHLRAAFNTLARSAGADSLDRQALMGHASAAMNDVYVYQGAEDLKRRGDLMMAVQAAIMGETKGVQ